ncbi:ABC transporter permease [Amycolatopsis cihanbeyliensis]|uniref:Peptide/nickel transport system permease protein n=1 Tax=Amycolatopsis cihanbeyliensis TaxID=1128664 RepID=A0A542DI69_AMYCI|nr:ABC transporter permease [Amycolatopsis cihanbeyliensis]TQJ02773.1 peptide/nickel transport system permease protein [Amycolatopsis cihanbeyliensis]
MVFEPPEALVPPSAGRTRHALRRLARSPAAILATATLLVMLVAMVVPDLVSGHDPEAVDPAHLLRPPSWAHPFGTDQLGRDLFSRVVHSARPSLGVALGATALAVLAGSVIGLLAGFVGGWLDAVLMRVVDVLLAFPALLLALAVVAVLGSSAVNVAIAVGLSNLATFARVVRAQVLHVRTRPYVAAATLSGVRAHLVLLRHVVPNVAGPVVLLGLLGIGVAMLASSSLSFLGFGPSPPETDWGTLAAAGRDYIGTAWWLTTFPGLAVAATVLAATTFGRVQQRQGVRR